MKKKTVRVLYFDRLVLPASAVRHDAQGIGDEHEADLGGSAEGRRCAKGETHARFAHHSRTLAEGNRHFSHFKSKRNESSEILGWAVDQSG